MGLHPQEFLVNELRVVAAPVDEDMVVGILDFQMSGGGHPGAIIFIHHEAANASIVEALFPQQWTHHKGVYNDMIFRTEMDNIAVPRSHSRRRRSMFGFVISNTRDREHHDAPQRECTYPGESDRSRAA